MVAQNRNIIGSILLLLLITVFLLVLHRFSLNSSFVIDGATDIHVEAIGDGLLVDGGSDTALEIDGKTLILDCQLVHKYQWPYCEFNIHLNEILESGEVLGKNFSSYDRVGFWLRFESEQKSAIRIHLRNFNPKYSDLNDTNSIKYNSIEIFPQNLESPLWIPMNSFQVATWWIVENNVDIGDIGPDFSNVYSIEVATGSTAAEGHYRLVMDRIEFQGKLISRDYLFLFIIVLWAVSGASYIIYWVYSYKRALSASKYREKELEAINRLLNVKSQELEDKVSRDPLTGVLNREGLQRLFLEGSISKDRTNGLCIAFMDIDHFKLINDNHGHALGDEVLLAFTQVISENTRSTELLARWGGEEFILACPNSNLIEIAAIAEKLRRMVESNHWPQGISVTCSFGVAQMGGESAEEFIERADKALYAAKAQGRNKVVISKGVGW